MGTIQEQLRKWADETADAYHKLATDPNHPECDLAFYTQSDLTKIDSKPELLILAINPGFGGSYTKQIKNPDWNLRDRMTGERLLQGNPCFKQHNSWHLWKVLRNIFSFGNISHLLEDERQNVWTNLTFFSTPKAGMIPDKAWESVLQTLELIKILRPKKILCLGKPCREKFQKHVSFRELIQGELYTGKLKESVVYAIPHPSKPNWSNAEKDMIGSSLGYLFNFKAENINSVTPELIQEKFGDKIKAWRNRQSTPTYKIDFKELYRKIEERIGEPFEKDTKTFRYKFTENTALTVTSIGEGYVGIRAIAKGAKNNDWNSNLENKNEYTRILLDDYKWKLGTQWLGTKPLKHIESVEKFIEDLSEIKKRFDRIG